MRISVIAILVLTSLLSLGNAQDAKQEDSGVAAVTTYVPMEGDHLVYDYVEKSGATTVVDATIASINTAMGAVTVNVLMTPKNRKLGVKPIRRTLEWFSTPGFIKRHFLGLSTRREVLRVGNFNIETTKVSSGDVSFWFTLNANGSSRYPEIIRSVRKGVVLINLKSITRYKKKKK
jgi:hypothetical protein